MRKKSPTDTLAIEQDFEFPIRHNAIKRLFDICFSILVLRSYSAVDGCSGDSGAIFLTWKNRLCA